MTDEDFRSLLSDLGSDSFDIDTPHASSISQDATIPSIVGIQSTKCKWIKISFIWWHAIPADDGSLDYKDADSDVCWRCSHCRQTYKQKSGTSKPVEHLRKVHRILEDTAFEQRTWHAQKTIQYAMTRASEIEEKRHLHRQSNASSQALDPAILEQLYVWWIMTYSVLFSQSSWTEFRSFLEYVNPEANRLLLHSSTTITG